MLETLRKHHYILMLFVAVIVCVAFVFFGDATHTRGGAQGTPLFKVDGKDYYQEDVRRISGQEALIGHLLDFLDSRNQMARFTDPLGQYANNMSRIAARFARKSREEANIDFVINVATLRSEAKKLGVEVDREDLVRFVQKLPAFQTNNQFDSQKYEMYLNSGVSGDRTNTEREFYIMLRDVMTYQKIQTLIGGSFAPSKAEVDFQYASQHELITAASALVEKAKQTPAAPTDADIQKFHDDEKAKFEKTLAATAAGKEASSPAADPMVLSEEKRAVRYLLINLPKRPEPIATPAPVAEDTSKLPEDQKKAKEEEFKKKMDEHTAALAKRATEMTDYEVGQEKLITKASEISNELVADDRGAKTFEEIVKANGLESKLSEPFTQAAPPEDLKALAPVIQRIFSAQPDQKIAHTVPYPTPQSPTGYALFELAAVNAPALLPLDQVKEKITEKLKAGNLTTALKAAADTARAKIQEGLKAGKSFTDAAKEAGLTAVELPAFSSQKRPAPDVKHASVITAQAATLNPGEVSEPQAVEEGLLLVSVIKKELPKDPKMEEDKKSLTESGTLTGEGPFSSSPLFEAWLNSKRSASAEVSIEPGA
ncbi:MAG: SurA N-terminal domain-containing protein [Verrucomicrobiota bacterium]